MLNSVHQVIISSYNSLGDGRYFDVESSSSFVFNHTTQVSLQPPPGLQETKVLTGR